jgi:hypothetical protein
MAAVSGVDVRCSTSRQVVIFPSMSDHIEGGALSTSRMISPSLRIESARRLAEAGGRVHMCVSE